MSKGDSRLGILGELEGVPPSPPTAENARQSWVSQRGYGKILIAKNLEVKILITKGLGVGCWGSGHRVRLQHNGLIYGVRQGWMSQGGCGKVPAWPMLALQLSCASPFWRTPHRFPLAENRGEWGSLGRGGGKVGPDASTFTDLILPRRLPGRLVQGRRRPAYRGCRWCTECRCDLSWLRLRRGLCF